MTSGGQCVMTPGTALMLLWSASSWDMHTLGVSVWKVWVWFINFINDILRQVAKCTAMPILVLAVDQFSWMMFSAAQVLISY